MSSVGWIDVEGEATTSLVWLSGCTAGTSTVNGGVNILNTKIINMKYMYSLFYYNYDLGLIIERSTMTFYEILVPESAVALSI